MSLFGALQSGISGLAAQSNAMGAISDNIVNVNTIGYKNNTTSFQTLVTKQTSTSYYSPGGVQPVSKQGINVQGLLSSVSSSTAVAISGDGYFVVNQAANPGEGDLWAYTRAGDFDVDEQGYLKNTGGFYAQGWSLLPWDGNPKASVVEIGGLKYMKAYYDSTGNPVYINDNIIDPRNLRPINLSTIGGTATATKQISFGANLPASDAIYNPIDQSGGKHKVSALIYDSLGNASNMSLNYYKTSSNGWSMDTSVPSGASKVSLHTQIKGEDHVYSSSGQLEFSSIPEAGSVITISTGGKTYNFQFGTEDRVDGENISVDITSATSVKEFSELFVNALRKNLPDGDRFTVQDNGVAIKQSTTGDALTIDASRTKSCIQSAANPVEGSGKPTGVFTVDKVSQDLTNGASIDFDTSIDDVADLDGKTITIDGVTFEFTNDGITTPGNVAITLDEANLQEDESIACMAVRLLSSAISNPDNGIVEPSRFVASGATLQILPSSTGPDVSLTMNMDGLATGSARVKGGEWGVINDDNQITIGNTFRVNEEEQIGSIVPAVRFNADGTPKEFFVSEMSIEWANGAQDMVGGLEGKRITLNMGNPGVNDGLTSLSGDFTTDYVRQDGAKFGSYSGVSIDESGVVTALFDNGETRPIAILPLATFSNPNGMESLTGNAWIETDYSGAPMLKRAGTNGAGEISSNALESSTVDLATEFSNMIVTQRAYSAATKIITTSDEMLEELTRLT